ncbi:MAG TPA: hypothetical protein VKD08_07380, partial [Ignavibacteriaceae bacterium]|nr:hypothetical protein [Ignavibacteriaceae bacterium]
MCKRIIFLLAVFICTSAAFAGDIIHHKISVNLEPGRHYLEVTDEVTIPAGQMKPVMNFLLNKNLSVTSESPEVILELDKSGAKAEDFGMDREDYDDQEVNNENLYSLTFKNNSGKEAVFTLKYNGIIDFPIQQMGEEYARGFSQT